MKFFKYFSLAMVAFALVACGGRHFRDTALYHPSGRAKPVVAVLPVINSCQEATFTWDLAHEMTEEIRKRVADSSRIYLHKSEATLATAQALNNPNPRNLPADVGAGLSPAEFVIVTELIDQNEIKQGYKIEKRPYLNEVGATINLAMRLRVVDLRGKEPRVVLQEVVQQEQKVGKGYLHIDYSKTPWGSAGFANTPLGMAHNKLIKELVAHVEGYIGL